MDNAENRVTTFVTKKNRFENIHVAYELFHDTPVVSVRSFRGDNFTGKGISLQPELWLKLQPEINRAIDAFRAELVERYGEQAALETEKIERKSKRKAAKEVAT
jgi:hypothetical protein